jgi:hypothetical protein
MTLSGHQSHPAPTVRTSGVRSQWLGPVQAELARTFRAQQLGLFDVASTDGMIGKGACTELVSG